MSVYRLNYSNRKINQRVFYLLRREAAFGFIGEVHRAPSRLCEPFNKCKVTKKHEKKYDMYKKGPQQAPNRPPNKTPIVWVV